MTQYYNIIKEGRQVSTVARCGNVTILDAALGVAYSETPAQFNEFLNALRAEGYHITAN